MGEESKGLNQIDKYLQRSLHWLWCNLLLLLVLVSSAGDERCEEEKFESNRRLLLAASQSSGERPVWKQLLSYI